MGFGMIFNLLLIAFLIYIAVKFFRGEHPGLCSTHGNHEVYGNGSHKGGEAAVEILSRRYAAGEITREQYRQILEDLKNK